jgi:hypothetical protein
MKNATTPKTAQQTGPLPALPTGHFVYRDGVWYMTPALKTAHKAHG